MSRRRLCLRTVTPLTLSLHSAAREVSSGIIHLALLGPNYKWKAGEIRGARLSLWKTDTPLFPQSPSLIPTPPNKYTDKALKVALSKSIQSLLWSGFSIYQVIDYDQLVWTLNLNLKIIALLRIKLIIKTKSIDHLLGARHCPRHVVCCHLIFKKIPWVTLISLLLL